MDTDAPETAINRPIYLNKLISFTGREPVKIISGVRRCGKSFMFKLFQKHLRENGVKQEQILDINFEDARNEPLLDWHKLHKYIEKRLVAKKKNYIFLDEIQYVQDFQKAVNSLRLKKNADLYLTGSNSKILSGEFATLLSGRYVEIHMLPLSFKEYASAYPYNTTAEQKYQDYIKNSSFPYTAHLTSARNPLLEKKDGWDTEHIIAFLQSVYNAVVLKDIIMRKNIKDAAKLERVIKFMFDNIGCETSVRNMYNMMKSAGAKGLGEHSVQIPTLENYLEA
jgi:predicted AAA+ superfamily ATPase